MKLISHSYEETTEFAKEFSKTLKPNDIILLLGDLGAGKTCFVNGILAGLGFGGGGCSPTFTIVNEYPTCPPINHFDLYRIASEDELYDMGFSEYLDSPRINLIEWPQIASEILKNYPTVTIRIQHTENEDERIITIEHSNEIACG